MDTIKLIRKTLPLTCSVEKDDYIRASELAFDCHFDGTSTFFPYELPPIPKSFKIGVIVGGSGSGKSTLLKEFGQEESLDWDSTKPIISHFDSPEEAINKLGAVGLNSIPSWYKPYHVLSNGEKFRVDLARKLKTGAVVDEFTSVVDRNVAKAASVSLSRFVKDSGLTNIVLSTCHHDIVDWLQPDWVINTDTGEMYDGFFLSDQKSMSKFIVQHIITGTCLKTITI